MNSIKNPFAAALLALMILCASGCTPQLPSVEELGPLAKIPPPNRDKYSFIRDGKDFLNPWLVVRHDGIEIIAQGMPSSSPRIIPVDRVKEVLIALPVSAWPYGRVVAASVVGIGTSSRSDELMRQNLKAMERVLKELDVTVDWWPS
jgi:hypothetical protein